MRTALTTQGEFTTLIVTLTLIPPGFEIATVTSHNSPYVCFKLSAMFIHKTQIRVRYAETDQMSYTYHGVYAQYYELGRVEALRSLGYSYKEMEEKDDVMMPVMTLHQRFVRPAMYDELLTIQTTLRNMPERFITFHVEIFNEKGKLVNGGSVKLCFLDKHSRKSRVAPDVLVDKLNPYFSNV